MTDRTCVLVVEDSAMNRRILSSLLRREGYEFTEVETGEAAVRLAAERRFDAILMDVSLPGIDGVEATTQIRSLHESPSRDAWIVGISAHASPRDEERFLDAGMNVCLAKPVDLSVLARVLNECRAGAEFETRATDSNAVLNGDPILDVNDALQRIGSDRSLYQRFLQTFGREIDELVDRAAKAVQEQSLPRLGEVAHRIRGMSANISAQVAMQSAAALERCCHEGDCEAAQLGFQTLQADLADLKREVAKQGFST